MSRYFTAILLYCFWNILSSYDKISFCHHALIYTTNCYRLTRDKKGSILLLALLIVPIMTIFHQRESRTMILLSTFLSTYLSMYFEPFFEFQQNMLLKSFADLAVACSTPTTDINSRFTDLVYMFVSVGYEIWQYMHSNIRYSIDDMLLIPIGVGHIVFFYFEYFTWTYFSIILSLTLSWMFLKSLRFPRKKRLLQYRLYEDLHSIVRM